MKMQAKCPACAYVMTLEVLDADTRKRCPRCSRPFRVPELQTLKEAMKVLKTSCSNIFVDEQGNTYA